MTPDTSTPRCDAHNSTTKFTDSEAMKNADLSGLTDDATRFDTSRSGDVDFILAVGFNDFGLLEVGQVEHGWSSQRMPQTNFHQPQNTGVETST